MTIKPNKPSLSSSSGRPLISADTIYRVAQDDSAATKTAPTQVASFKVICTLGEGGSGVVYCAEQDAPRRHVALKLLKRVGPQSIRRFKREANALGKLQHRGIAQIFGAGEAESLTGSVPYIAMELVDGLPITRYANDARLPIRKRLSLLLEVCDALAYAHSRGIVHRDLKPSNILVNAAGEPKVLDFGLSFDTGSEATLATEPGQIVGTLAYMSPEQAQGTAIDARTDVYSLGIIAYELLAGRRPYEVPGDAPLVAARQIVESNPPSLASIDRSLRGDLNTILSKALEKDPARRYSTVADFAEDLCHYLSDTPIRARRPTLRYRGVKFIRRHKTLVIATSAVILTLIAGLIGMTREAANARESEKRARASERQAKLNLAESFMSNGKAWFSAGKMREARESYLSAWDAFEQLGEQTLPAELGVWDVDRQHPRPIARWKAHEGAIVAVAMSEPAGIGVSAGEDKFVRVWNLRTLREMFHAQSSKLIRRVAVASNGALAAFADVDGDITLIDIGNARIVKKWHAEASVTSLVFSSNGSQLAWSAGRRVMLAEANSFKEPRSVFDGANASVDVILSGDRWVAFDGKGKVTILENERVVHAWIYNTRVECAAVLSTNELIAISGNNEVAICRLSDGYIERKISTKTNSLGSLAGEGPLLASATNEGLELWDAGTGLKKQAIMPWNSGVRSYECSGTTVFYGNADGTIAFLNAATNPEVKTPLPLTQGFCAVAANSDSRVITGDNHGNVVCWNSKSGAPIYRAKVPEGVRVVTPYDSEGNVYLGLADGSIWRWLPSNNPPIIFSRFEQPVTSLALSPDGRKLAAATDGMGEKTIAFLSLGSQTIEWAPGKIIQSNGQITWSDQNLARAVDIFGVVWNCDTETKTVTRFLQIPIGARKICSLPDNRLAAAYPNGHVRVWQGQDPNAFEYAACPSPPVGFFPVCNGKYLVCIEMGGDTHINETATGKSVANLALRHENVTGASIGPDDHLLSLSCENGDVVFIDFGKPREERIVSKQLGTESADERTSPELYRSWLEQKHPVLLKGALN